MKAILDRLEWIASYMRMTQEEREADEQAVKDGKTMPHSSAKEIAWQSWEQIQAIAETLPDQVNLSVPNSVALAEAVKVRGESPRNSPARIIDIP